MANTVEIQLDVHRGITHRGESGVIPDGKGPANFASGQLDYFEVRATNGRGKERTSCSSSWDRQASRSSFRPAIQCI